MDLFYGILDEGTVALAESGWLDSADLGDVVTARAQPEAIAPGGIGREVALGHLYTVIRHDGACRVQLIPVIDNVLRVDLLERYDLAAVADPVSQVIRLDLSEPLTWPGDMSPFSRQAIRGIFVTVQVELEPRVDDAAVPDGLFYAIGGISVDVRPVGTVAGTSIPVAS